MSGDDGLREAIESAILDRWRVLLGPETYGEASAKFADAVLALPEVAALRARATAAPTTVALSPDLTRVICPCGAWHTHSTGPATTSRTEGTR